ncbi:DUF3275 family protein [Uruburuella suis]|uniref:DUF3275 family protein n=1 Tax=Uruburuella suis TaxID=252130 RepID=UPI00249309E6|nr:DUF3275 family protein [Uruburuella suis]
MSISIPGTLNVIERQGRKGAFMVAELQTEIGSFDLKHRVLEQFSEGAYEGIFIITRIFNQAVTWRNGTWTKLCADLDWEALRIMAQSDEVGTSDSLAMAQIMAEAEAEEEPKQETAPAAVVPPRQVEAQADDAAVYDLDTLTVLIMDGVPRIRLDATLEDRRLFTELRNALKNAGYRFDGKTQSWYFPEAA